MKNINNYTSHIFVYFFISNILLFSQIADAQGKLDLYNRARPVSIEDKKWIFIGKHKPALTTFAELTYIVDNENDTTYRLWYRNSDSIQINDYQSIYFNSVGNTLNVFYDLLMKAFSYEDPKEYTIDIILGETLLKIRGTKTMGLSTSMEKAVLFITPQGTFPPLNESQIKKLFARE